MHTLQHQHSHYNHITRRGQDDDKTTTTARGRREETTLSSRVIHKTTAAQAAHEAAAAVAAAREGDVPLWSSRLRRALAAGVPWGTAIAVAEPRCFGGSGYYYTYEQFRDYYTSVGAADYTDTAWSQATVEQPPPLALPPTATAPPASPPNPSINNLQFDLASILAQVSAATATAMSSELGPLLLASSTRSDEAARVKAGAMPVLTEATTRQPMGVREFIRNIRWQSRAASNSQQAAAAPRSLDPAIVSRATRHCRNENLPTTTLDEIEAVLLAVYPQPGAAPRVYEQQIGVLF